MKSIDTSQLRKLYTQLGSNIPGDLTHAAAVATLLRGLVEDELATRAKPAEKNEPALNSGAPESLVDEHYPHKDWPPPLGSSAPGA